MIPNIFIYFLTMIKQMRKRLVIIGIILIMIGFAFTVAGSYGIIKNVTLSTEVVQHASGEYISSKMIMNESSTLLVMGTTTNSGLIKASDLSIVNESNLHSYEIQYNSKQGNTLLYEKLTGEYYFVAFTSTAPNLQYAYGTGSLGQFLLSSMLTVLGPFILIAGIVVSVVGAIIKPKKDPFDDLLK